MMTLKFNLAGWRHKHGCGVTQRDVAEFLNVQPLTVGRWERSGLVPRWAIDMLPTFSDWVSRNMTELSDVAKESQEGQKVQSFTRWIGAPEASPQASGKASPQASGKASPQANGKASQQASGK